MAAVVRVVVVVLNVSKDPVRRVVDQCRDVVAISRWCIVRARAVSRWWWRRRRRVLNAAVLGVSE